MKGFGRQEQIEWADRQKERLFRAFHDELVTTDEYIQQVKMYNELMEEWELEKEKTITTTEDV